MESLTALKAEFVADLEVSDEGEYWEHRDLGRLRHKFAVVGGAIDSLAKTLSEDDLSPEAAEDPEILAARIERLARKVQETMSRVPEHPPVSFPDDEFGRPTNLAEEEARYDALYQENRRRQVAMERSIEEGLLRGEDAHEAFEMAMREVLPPEPEEDVEGNGASELEVDLGRSESETETREEWRGDEHAEESFDFAPNRVVRHPLQRQAIDLLVQFHDIAQHYEGASSNIGSLLYSGGEVMGGLAQAFPLPPIYELDDVKAGLALVQLKRALRGTAFVIGAIRLLRDDKVIDEEKFREFSKAVGAIEAEIIELLRAIRHARM